MGEAGICDKRVAPDIPALLRLLIDHDVEFVLCGSVAVEAWGIDVGTPGDLDIAPATDRANLERLADMLHAIGAVSWPVTGRWMEDDGEFRWHEFAVDDPRRGRRLVPDPDDIATFDNLFSTRHGELDIVPRISGTYERLALRAVPRTVRGVDDVPVTHVDDLLAFLTVPRRRKDAGRVRRLREAQREWGGPLD